MQFDRRLGSIAADAPVKLEGDTLILNCQFRGYMTRIYNKTSHRMLMTLHFYGISIQFLAREASQITKFMGPTWGPHGPYRPQMGPVLAPWTLLSGLLIENQYLCVDHSLVPNTVSKPLCPMIAPITDVYVRHTYSRRINDIIITSKLRRDVVLTTVLLTCQPAEK